jgi:drug/metabolite transporter (DMT)-like permease
MPFWVWLAFQEIPALRALVGGALVMGAVAADVMKEDNRLRRNASNPQSND